MRILTASLFFVLLTTVIGVITTEAYADHSMIEVSVPAGTNILGCEKTNECFIPADITVDKGSKVIWSNDDTAAHTVTSGDTIEGPNGNFDSSLFLSGKTYSVTFDDVGVHPYFCLVHPWMVGTVTVTDSMEDQEESATGMLSDGSKVEIYASAPAIGEMMEIKVEFNSEHANYDVIITQNGKTVLDESAVHTHTGMQTHMTDTLDSTDSVDIEITFQGYGVDEKLGPIGEVVTFTNIIPEFGIIATMILAVAIISVMIVTTRSKFSMTQI